MQNRIIKTIKPTPPPESWFGIIATRIFFPFIIVWDIIKFIINQIFGELVGRFILPSQNKISNINVDEVVDEINQKDRKLFAERKFLMTDEGVRLDTLEITQRNYTKNMDQYIIFFPDDDVLYEEMIPDMKYYAKRLGCNVIGFNYRNVSRSKFREKIPGSTWDLVTDGLYQVQRLLDEGIKAENIHLKGDGYGAAYATLVAAHLHEHKQPVFIFNGRSFSTLTKMIVGWIRAKPGSGHQETTLGEIGGWLARPFISLFLSLTKWEIDAEKVFQFIPETHRKYMLVRTPHGSDAEKPNKILKDILPLEKPDDYVDDDKVKHYSSLHMSLRMERWKKKVEVREDVDNAGRYIQSTAFKYGEKTREAAIKNVESRKEMLQELENFMLKKMYLAKDRNTDGHYVSEKKLRNFRGDSACDFFVDAFNQFQRYKEIEKNNSIPESYQRPILV